MQDQTGKNSPKRVGSAGYAANNKYLFSAMPSVHLIFTRPEQPLSDSPPLEIVLQGTLQLSPYMEINGEGYTLHGSYCHADGTTENIYHPLFSAYVDRN